MLDFRQFEAGPDPFGRTYSVMLKWLQTAIALRHSDTVDVKFILEHDGTRVEKTFALPHPDLLTVSRETGHALDDAWCARLAANHLRRIVATGEDMEKDLITVPREDLLEHAAAVASDEQAEIQKRRG